VNHTDSKNERRVKPGAILRALGASDDAIQAKPWNPDLASTAHMNTGSNDSSVELVRDGARVVRILVHCKCGETTTIECDYENAEAPSSDGATPA